MKKTPPFLILMIISFFLNNARTQTGIQVSTSISLDYFTTQSKPMFQGQGYPNQILIRSGIGTKININKRISIGMNFEYYARKEKYDCMYFTGPDDPPMRSHTVFINNPLYDCEFRGGSKIQYLDIPLVLGYDFLVL